MASIHRSYGFISVRNSIDDGWCRYVARYHVAWVSRMVVHGRLIELLLKMCRTWRRINKLLPSASTSWTCGTRRWHGGAAVWCNVGCLCWMMACCSPNHSLMRFSSLKSSGGVYWWVVDHRADRWRRDMSLSRRRVDCGLDRLLLRLHLPLYIR
jgi:hypothetical protein